MADVNSVLVPVDLDTGGGTDFLLGVSLRLENAGGNIIAQGQKVMASSIPVAIASDQGDLGVDNAGTFAVQEDGAALTALQLIDDIVATLGTTTYAEATTKGAVIGAVRNDTLAALANTDNEIAPLQVNASGALYIQEGAALDVSAANVTVVGTGTFAVQVDGDALTALQLIDDVVATFGTTTYAEATTKGAAIGAVRNDTLATLVNTDNEIAPLQVNASGALYIQEGAALDVSAATVTVDTELPTAVSITDDNTAAPTAPQTYSHMIGFDGTDWARVRTSASGNLQVDVLSGGGSDTPTNPVTDGVEGTTPLNVAAGAEGDITTPEAANKKLTQVTVWSSVNFRCRLYTVDNGVESTDPLAVGGGQAFQSWTYEPPHRNYITLGATAGLDAFRVEVKNLDDQQAADFYAVLHYED